MKNLEFFVKNILPILTFIVAVMVAFFTIQNVVTNTKQINKLNMQTQLSRKRQQAFQVASWIVSTSTPSQDGNATAKIMLSNGNKTPVYNLFVVSILSSETVDPLTDIF